MNATAKNLVDASKLLTQAAALLDGTSHQLMVQSMARALRMEGVIQDATLVVELPYQAPERWTVRQEPTTGAVTMIDRTTGAARQVSILILADHGLDAAWAEAG